jgi:iron complex outermembrane receptor protein
VVITGSTRERKLVDAPYAITAISAAELRSSGPMVNLSEALQSVPGLVVANRSNYAQDLQISSRGFGARAGFGVRGLRLYSDGIPATMPDGQGQVAHFDLAGAQRIEVLRGPFSALYGNSSGGVIALFSAPVKETAAEVGVDTGSFGLKQQRVAVQSPFAGGFSIAASLTNFSIDGLRPQSDADRRLANVRLGWVTDDDRINVSISDQHQRASDPLGLTRALYDANPDQVLPGALTFNTRKTIDQTQAGLSWTHRVGGDSPLLSTQLATYAGQRAVFQMLSTPRANQIIPPAAANTVNANSAGGVIDFDRVYNGVDARLNWLLGDADLTTGLNLENQRDKRRGFENFIDTPAPAQLGVVGNLRRDEINRAETREAYAQLQKPLSEAWLLTAGVRTGSVELSNEDHYVHPAANPTNPDDSGTLKFKYTSPVVGLRLRVDDALTLHASASRGYESPTLGEVAYRPDSGSGFNTDLQAQTSRQIELGAKWRAGIWAVDTAVFDVSTNNEIGVASNSGGRSIFKNVGATRRQGSELSGQWRASPTLRGQLALTVLRATYRSADLAGNRIAGTQPASAYADVAWSPWADGEWALEWRGQGRTAINDANADNPAAAVRTGGFASGWGIANLRYLHRWTLSAQDKVELLARVDNLADRQYVGSVIVAEANQRYFEPAPGRNYLASLRYRHSW